MSKQAETYLGQRAQTLAPAAESRMESFTGSPSNGEGFPTGVRATSFLNQTSIYPTSHLLLHSSAVPLSSAFSGDSNTFQAALKDERDVPRFCRSKTIKPHPAARLSSNVLFHKMDRILLVSTPDHSPSHPSQAHLYSAIKVTARSNFKCVSIARWWCGGNKRTSELL